MPIKSDGPLDILIVDDFEGFRFALMRMLDSLGAAQIDTANTGESAIRMCRSRNYKAIIADYNLGAGKTGLQVLEALRFHKILHHQQAFMLVSAENTKNVVLAAADVEPDAYLTKPVTAKSLQQRLSKILQQRFLLSPLYQALESEDSSAVIEFCKEHIRKKGQYSPICQKMLGEALINAGDLDEAHHLYQSVLAQRELDWAILGLSKVNMAKGEGDIAEKKIGDFLQVNPFFMRGYDFLSNLYESQEQFLKQQEVLQKAVQISPLALLRQQKLLEVASDNHDYLVAAQTGKRVVRLAQNSVYSDLNQFVLYSQNAVKYAQQVTESSEDFCEDSQKYLMNKIGQLKIDNLQHATTNCVLAQLNSAQNKMTEANNLVQESEMLIATVAEEDVSLDFELEYVRALKATSEKQKATEKLNFLVKKYAKDDDALAKIDDLLDDPVSKKNTRYIAEINRRGIEAYQAKEYPTAIQQFLQARRLSPNHIGVNLNLIQVMVEDVKHHGVRQEYVEDIEKSLSKVRTRISKSDAQFDRLRALENEIHQLRLFDKKPV
ncbi:response regulator [Sessilibacter sp. MAH4]